MSAEDLKKYLHICINRSRLRGHADIQTDRQTHADATENVTTPHSPVLEKGEQKNHPKSSGGDSVVWVR